MRPDVSGGVEEDPSGEVLADASSEVCMVLLAGGPPETHAEQQRTLRAKSPHLLGGERLVALIRTYKRHLSRSHAVVSSRPSSQVLSPSRSGWVGRIQSARTLK